MGPILVPQTEENNLLYGNEQAETMQAEKWKHLDETRIAKFTQF